MRTANMRRIFIIHAIPSLGHQSAKHGHGTNLVFKIQPNEKTTNDEYEIDHRNASYEPVWCSKTV
ncbi:hypothetical protein [Jeotgalibacillus sp. R-1-5s-1]|uniref:hypothetical protein n=1 Tax=Jeotgalibacillus sp. R-1-5s-1 TaxID=2555897 RepID=UPI001069F273|nr:hypothetical protein [Jeotgalibacillus sp. R-1-5s-1]TFD94384.1 hypothetical protein E2491_13150 [Jeotgalibacillus sp. R-1-5s-1]